MIINLTSESVTPKYETEHKEIKLDLPQINFEDDQFVQVNEIAIFFKEPVKNLIGILTTTLIERNPMNANQQLIYFQQTPKAIHFLYSPTHLVRYKIHRSSLDTAEFKIHFTDDVRVETIYFQLEITNASTGVQSICS